MHKSHEHNSRLWGFSLVELSIALVIISVILASVLPFIIESTKMEDSDQTVERVEAIEEALLAFFGTNNRMPCPGDLTDTVNTANYGTEAGVAGACAGANYNDAGNGVVAGMVPVKALNLPDVYAFDGWGRRFTYHVTTAATNGAVDGTITIEDHAAANRTTEAVYAIVSHGETGHGAYTVGATRLNAGVSTAKELENCDCTVAAVDDVYDNVLVKGMEYPTGVLTTLFDDVVVYMTLAQIQQRSYVNIINPLETFTVFKNGTQTSTGVYADLLGWAAPVIIDTAYSFNAGTGVLTFQEDGRYMIIVNVEGTNNSGNRTEMNIQLQEDTGGGFVTQARAVWRNYSSRNGTQDGGGITGNYIADYSAGDEIKIQIRDIGVDFDVVTDEARFYVVKL